MKVRASVWISGLVGSVAAHVAILALLMIAINPEQVTEQPMPSSELEVQAYELDRTDAREQQPDAQQTNAEKPEGTALDAGAIPKSKARAAPVVAEPLSPDTAPAPPAAEIKAAGDIVPQASAPSAVIAQITPTLAKVIATQKPVSRIKPAEARPAVMTQTMAPAFVPVMAVLRTEPKLPVAVPAVAAVPSSEPETTTAPSGQIDAADVPVAAPDAQKLKAALAFSGGDGDIDPVSVAAFQSFMQPGDIEASGDQLRDGVEGLLAQVPCSRMQVAFDPDTATLQVNGHIPDGDLRAPVLAALRTQMGANITVSDNILILPRPQCGALSGIAGVGLPQSTDQITNPLVIGEDAHARVFDFTKGDLWALKMTAPDYDAYIYLDYFDAAGNVLHVEPNEQVPLRLAYAQEIQEVGAQSDQGAGLKLVIGPPYGQEIAVAFAASKPLYDGVRPIQEPAAAYLEWLKGRVALAREENADFKGEWVYFFVSTTEN